MEKLEYIENLRWVATLAVVLMHISSVSYFNYCQDLDSTSAFCVNYFWTVSRFCVPVFIMITGALLLDPQKKITLRKLYITYICRILTILGTIGLSYAAMETLFSGETSVPFVVEKSIIKVLTGDIWDHMWYLYMLIGLYIILPIIKSFVNSCTSLEFNITLLVLSIFGLVLPTIERVLGFKCGIIFPIQGAYIFYLLLGYKLSTTTSRNLFVPLGMLLTVVIFLYLILFYNNLASAKYFGYSSPCVCFLSISIFILFKDLSKPYQHILFKYGKIISKYSLGIYIFHPLYLNIINKVLKYNPLSWGGYSFMGVICVCVICSIITTKIFRYIPIIGKYI